MIAAMISIAITAARAVRPYSAASPTRSAKCRVRRRTFGGAAAVSTGASFPHRSSSARVRHHFVTWRSHAVHPILLAAGGDSITVSIVDRTQMAPVGVATPPPAPERREAVFDIDDLSVSYGQAPAIKGASLDIYRNAITAIIGPSGCGKSTFLRCLNRMNDLVPNVHIEGKLLYHGVDLYGPGVDPIEVRRRIGMVFQRPNPFPKSIYDNVAYGLRILGMKDNLDDRVEQALKRAALWDEVKHRLKKSALGLSGGQQQRLCIARAIAVEPDVILLDEPAS